MKFVTAWCDKKKLFKYIFFSCKNMKEFRIRELDLNLINPNNLNFSKSDQGGSKIVII